MDTTPIIVDGILENDPGAPVALEIQQAGFQGFIGIYQWVFFMAGMNVVSIFIYCL